MSLQEELQAMGQRAKKAALELAGLSGAQRQTALLQMREKLIQVKQEVMEANAVDVASAKSAGLDAPMIKRLTITDKVFDYMLSRLTKVADMDDPVGCVLSPGSHTRPTGLQVQKVTVPIGVIAIIYESRPNVTTDAACVCLKSGNAVILRGGSESLNTNRVLAKAMIEALQETGLPADAVQLISHKGHESVEELLKLDDYVNVIIPRGGKNLIQRVSRGTNIPVLKHYEGICHQYLAADAPPDWARDVVVNSKCQSIEVCNALETILVDAALLSSSVLLDVCLALDGKGVEIRGCERVQQYIKELDVCRALEEKGVEIDGCELIQQYIKEHEQQQVHVVLASEEDWSTEYLAPIISIRVVDGIEQAIQHINHYGSGHTDGIITGSLDRARQFVNGIDSASVLVNASTRLSGGGDYGLGAVVGISTDRLHARGPVGPAELTTYKWVAYGQGHLR